MFACQTLSSRPCRTAWARVLGILLTVASTSVVAGDPAPWRAGLASINITPQEPVRMAGYASRTEPYIGVASELFAKALALEDSEGNRGVIVTTDLIGFQAPLTSAICDKIEARTGLAREQIVLNASHIHSGPTLGLDAETLEFDDPVDTERTIRYTTALQDKLAEVVESALQNLQPARLSWGVGVAEFVMNRREFTERGVILGFNPRGHVDRSVPVLRIDDPEGGLRGVLFGAACHNTTLGNDDHVISGDFAGYAQALLQAEHPGVTAMFMQGCAGDANPHPRGGDAIARQHGRSLAAEVERVLAESLQPVTGPLSIANEPVELPLQASLSRRDVERLRDDGGGWRGWVAEKMLETLERDGALPETFSAPMAVWQFGGSLTLVLLSGEVVVDYAARLAAELGPQKLWVAAYCNDVFGYLPSARILKEGGYETRGLYRGKIGFFTPAAEDTVVEHVAALARRAANTAAASSSSGSESRNE